MGCYPCCHGLFLVTPGQGCSQHLHVPCAFATVGGKAPAFLFLLEVNARQSPVLPCSLLGSSAGTASEAGLQGGCKCTRSTTASTLALGSWSFCPYLPLDTSGKYPVSKCPVSPSCWCELLPWAEGWLWLWVLLCFHLVTNTSLSMAASLFQCLHQICSG